MTEGSPPSPWLGAHVSSAGGVDRAPARGRAIGATAIQIFTKTPSQWREPTIEAVIARAFSNEQRDAGIAVVVSHDSYLINLASPDRNLYRRSLACFRGELMRCQTLGIPYVVTHPGNFMDDRERGLVRNAAAYHESLDEITGPGILIETTAGSGSALGSCFEELTELRERVPEPHRSRIGFCADTCHLYAAGYDLRHDWDGVWELWDTIVGLEHLKCFHVNDSKTPLGSQRDRHELIGEGTLGRDPFRWLMQDPRFRNVIKIIETPKGDDMFKTDRRMLRRLRTFQKS